MKRPIDLNENKMKSLNIEEIISLFPSSSDSSFDEKIKYFVQILRLYANIDNSQGKFRQGEFLGERLKLIFGELLENNSEFKAGLLSVIKNEQLTDDMKKSIDEYYRSNIGEQK